MALRNKEKYFWFKPRNKLMHKIYDNVNSSMTQRENIMGNTYIKKTCGKENCNCKCNEKNKEKDNS
jgi:hypothetical protein